MKPIKIVISAFGSYADKTEISFDEVNSGIFLIAGDTGAGKTTIFDAITYALYEQTSGGVRDGNMMRSQFADEDTLTYVELTFTYQDKVFKVRRNPQYERRSKRKTADGTGYTTETPKVELTLSDGKVFMGNKTETNNKITEILGIDKEQFTQIAMIAQGDFLKLLHANSDERKRIFSKIFDTSVYSKIQESLQNKIREINTELAKNKTLCEHELKNIVYLEGSAYEDLWLDLISGFEFKTDEVLELLKKINSEIMEKEKNINNNRENVQTKLNDVFSAINSAETINSLFRKLRYCCDIKKELEIKNEEQQIKGNKLDSAKKAERVEPDESRYMEKISALASVRERIIDINKWLEVNEIKLDVLSKELEICEKNKVENEADLTQNIAIINASLSKYDELEGKKSLVIELEKEKKLLEQNIDILKSDIEDKKVLKLKIENEQDNLKNCYAIFTELQINVKDVEKRVVELDELNSLTQELSFVKEKYDISINKANNAFGIYSKANVIYEEMYKAFLREQAGILAKERLVDNMPCPVCGSTNHPSIAALSEHAPTQVDVENAKKERDMAEKQSSGASEKLQSNRQRYDMILELVLSKAKQLIKKDFTSDASDLRLISQVLENSVNELEINKVKLNVATENKNRFEINVKSLDDISKEITKKTSNLDEIANRYNEVNLEYTTLSISIKELKKQLLFESKNEAVQGLNMYKSKLDALNNSVTNATSNYNSLLRTIGAKKGQQISEFESEQRIKIEVEDTKNLYYNSIEINNFTSEEEYKEAKLTASQIEALQFDIDNYNKKLSDINNEIRIYMEQTEGKSEVSLDIMLKTKNELSIELDEIEKEFKIVYTLYKKNSDALTNIENLFKDRKETRVQYEIYNSLNVTANGKISENIKMDFETYIQRQYFNKIIAAANKRLEKMSSGQFILQCRDMTDLGYRGPVGLDLDIYSLVTDTTRDIKTLSGGESFMAALSMALGLSDVIQSTAGAVHLDTMFIDEGFGSLDDNSRAQSISVLNELAGNNRLVGIISHVNELKEQIDNKLLVRKSEKGSTVIWFE